MKKKPIEKLIDDSSIRRIVLDTFDLLGKKLSITPTDHKELTWHNLMLEFSNVCMIKAQGCKSSENKTWYKIWKERAELFHNEAII